MTPQTQVSIMSCGCAMGILGLLSPIIAFVILAFLGWATS